MNPAPADGAVQSQLVLVISVVVAVANVVLALLTWWYAHLTHKSLDFAKKQAEALRQPRILAHLYISRADPTLLALQMVNVGEEPAQNIHLAVEPSELPCAVDGYATIGRLPIFASRIPQFARGQVIETYLLNMTQLNPGGAMHRLCFTVSYWSVQGQLFQEEFDYDLRIFGGLRPPREPMSA
jgi:hypothetical protein